MRKNKKVIWFHRTRGILWGVFGVLAFAMGWQNNIGLVWFASAYANALTDWGAGEAADDTAVLKELAEVRKQNAEIIELLKGRNDS